jgi:hypothetical protein
MQGDANFLDQPTGELRAGYEAMAADQAREREAMEWCEALVVDCFIAGDSSMALPISEHKA